MKPFTENLRVGRFVTCTPAHPTTHGQVFRIKKGCVHIKWTNVIGSWKVKYSDSDWNYYVGIDRFKWRFNGLQLAARRAKEL
jgi:hypothetical protein